MNKVKINLPESADYEVDYFAWTADQAKKLRAARPAGLDWENVAEEIESLGRSDKRRIEGAMNVILVHLLKWAFQPQMRSASWKGTIFEHRRRISKLVGESPSLRTYPAKVLAEEYEAARLNAAGETSLPEDRFPIVCPFSVHQVLDQAFLPK